MLETKGFKTEKSGRFYFHMVMSQRSDMSSAVQAKTIINYSVYSFTLCNCLLRVTEV